VPAALQNESKEIAGIIKEGFEERQNRGVFEKARVGMTLPLRPQNPILFWKAARTNPRSCFTEPIRKRRAARHSIGFPTQSEERPNLIPWWEALNSIKGPVSYQSTATAFQGAAMWPSKFGSTRRSSDEISVERAAFFGADRNSIRGCTKATFCRCGFRRLRRELFSSGRIVQASVPHHVQHSVPHRL
jgi:hypothetical protein